MSSRLNILMLSDVYFPRINGVSTSIETFRRELLGQGHRVSLVVPTYQAGDLVDRSGIVRVPGWPVPRDPEDRIMRWHALRLALARFTREPWDVIHVHTPFLAHLAGVQLAVELDCPLVTSYHTLFEEYLHHYVPVAWPALTRGFARRVSRHQCHQADAVVVPSQAIRDRLAAYGVGEDRMHVLPTGLPDSAFDRGDGAAFRLAHGLEPDRPLALFVGRVAHEKNVGFLLEALRTTVRQVPRAMLVVAGDGPALPALRAEVQRLGLGESVRFLGYVSRGRRLADCYAAADVFAFASRTETQGLVLLEAMAQGVPVLALAEMGTREILEGSPGAVIGSARASEFGAQLAELLAEPRQREALAAGAAAWARHWSGRTLAQRLAELYASLGSRTGRARGSAVRVLDSPRRAS